MNKEFQKDKRLYLTDEELLSKTIDFLRLPLTVLVVFIHFNFSRDGITFHSVTYGLDNPQWYYWFFDFISETIARVSVPLFFFISGFLFFYRTEFDFNVFKRKVKSRIRTLFLPYFLWNTVSVLFFAILLLPVFTNIAPKNSEIEMHFSLQRLFHTYFTDFYNEGIFVKPTEPTLLDISNVPLPINGVLWFVRDLMVIILITPVIYWVIKKLRIWFVVLTGMLWYSCQVSFLIEDGWNTLLSRALFFFSWGAYFSINKTNFISIFSKSKYIPLLYLLIAIYDVMTKTEPYNVYIHHIGVLLGLVTFVLIGAGLVARGKAKLHPLLSNSCFFIFACHDIFIKHLGQLLFYLFKCPKDTWSLLGFYLLVPLLTITICFVLYMLIRKIMPTICDWFTGGRYKFSINHP